MISLPKVLVLSGCTGIGKTHLAQELCLKFNGEIISADSIQVYKGLDIGSRKYSNTNGIDRIPQHLTNILENTSIEWSAGDFREKAREITKKLIDNNKIPIIVGGTGFYLKWYLADNPFKRPPVDNMRDEINKKLMEINQHEWTEIYLELAKIDPVYAKTINQNDYLRLARGLVVYEKTGKPFSSFLPQVSSDESKEYDFRCFFLFKSNYISYKQQVDRLCEEMIADGLIEEVLQLIEKQILTSPSSASKAIGYRHVLEYLADDMFENFDNFYNFISRFQVDTKQFGKRQKTWFRKQKMFRWIDLDASPNPVDTISNLFLLSPADYQKQFKEYELEKEKDFERDKQIAAQSRVYVPQRVIFNNPNYVRHFLRSFAAKAISLQPIIRSFHQNNLNYFYGNDL